MTNWIDELVQGSPLRSKIGFRGELEFFGATEGDQSGRTVTFRLVRRPEEVGAAHPFSIFTRRRGKTAGSIFEVSIVSIATGLPVYAGELMLANWADGPKGATVKFWCDMGGDHPFLVGHARPSAKTPGTRYMAVMLEKQDDEQIVEQERVERAEVAQKTGKRAQLLSNAVAVILKNPRFHDWLNEYVMVQPWNEREADVWLKAVLKIDSKRELDDDKNQAAIVGWNRIRLAFVAWQQEQGFIDERHPE
jgi:hypothetical protein